MAKYKIILRKETGKLQVTSDFCEAKNAVEAQKIFEDRHGPLNIVGGPFKVVEEAKA